MDARNEKRSGFPGERKFVAAPAIVAAAMRRHSMLRELATTAAGYFPKAAGHLRRRVSGCAEAILIYCARGGGWCECGGQLHPVRRGDLLVLPPGGAHAYGAHASNPWTIHWAHATGERIADYLSALGVSAAAPCVPLGEQMQVISLFNEALSDLEHDEPPLNLFHAAHTLGHLLSVILRLRRVAPPASLDTAQRVGQCIIHMSEHLDRPLKTGALAALASLSPAHFTMIFKQQTGCTPRDYHQLLRMHRACQFLGGSALSVKEVAARLGYQDQFHFSRAFKAFQGVSPVRYRAAGGR